MAGDAGVQLKLAKFYNSGAYHVILKNPVRGTVHGWLVDAVSLQTSSQWSALMEQSDSGVVNKLAQVVTTRSSKVGAFSDQMWQGSEMPTISVTIGRVAISSTGSEIIEPSKSLLSWNLPPTANNPLEPPIKTTGVGASEGISIGIGRWFFARGLLPQSVSVNYDQIFDRYTGAPIKYSATIVLAPCKIVTASDLLGWFRV